MSHCIAAFRRILLSEEGATMVEYGLMVALIAVVAIGAISSVGGSISGGFTSISNNL